MGRSRWQWTGALAFSLMTACGGSSRSPDGQAPASAERPAPTPAVSAPGLPCATPDDSTGSSISGTFRARPEPLYAAGSAALRELGFAVLENLPPRELITAPGYAWPPGTERESWHGAEHPGIEMFLFTLAVGDSTTVTIGARALCRVAGASGGQRDSEVGRNLEGILTLAAMNALITRLRTMPPS